jgi:hypothetical protein
METHRRKKERERARESKREDIKTEREGGGKHSTSTSCESEFRICASGLDLGEFGLLSVYISQLYKQTKQNREAIPVLVGTVVVNAVRSNYRLLLVGLEWH